MSDNIMFSFLELTSSDFEFPIYRKSYSDETRNSGMFRYKLPTSQVRDDYDVYAVSFTPADGCTQFICNSHDNIHLTKKWILDGLIAKANSTFSSDKYFVEQGFIHYISFIIATYKEGLRVIQVEPYYLEKNNSFGFILDFKFKANKGYEKTRQEKMLSLSLAADGSKNKNYYSDKLKYITAFIANTLSKIYPIEIDTVSIDVKRTLTDISSFLLDEKVYIFNNGEGTVQFQGIKEYKPLNSVSDNPLFIFVFEKSKVNTARQLVKALRGQLYTTFSGMEDMFGVKFDNDNIQSIIVDNYSKESLSYIEACIDNIVRENQTAQIAGVFAGIEKDFDTDKDYSPYYAVKSYFLKHGLAIQAVTIEQALKRDGFKWSISGIALQLFVKLGGQPWKVKPQQENCLIFGISSAHIKDSENKTTKYFAYSLCFDSSGIYKRLNILGQSTDEKTYIEQLAERIKASLSNEIGSDISKCVVHVPYKLKRTEMYQGQRKCC